MNTIVLEVGIIIGLVLVNGALAMAEMAIVSARRGRLLHLLNEGDQRAESALKLANAPGRFLSTVQIGITLVGVLNGAFSGATIAGEIASWLERIHFLAPYSEIVAVFLVVTIITYVSLVVGELAPKRIALANPERIALVMARTMTFLSKLTAPLVSFLSVSSNVLVRLLGLADGNRPAVTEDEVRFMIAQGTRTGVFMPIEEEMVEHVFELSERKVSAITTPRTEVMWVDISDDLEAIREKIQCCKHSGFPVADGDLDRVLGWVESRDLLEQTLSGKQLNLDAALQPALFLPEDMPALQAVDRFRDAGTDIALVLDEYGGLQGMVALVDILEAIIGDIPSLHEEEQKLVVQREDGSYLLDGRLPIDDLRELLGARQLGEDYGRYYETLGGLVMTLMERIPSAGDSFTEQGWRFEIMDMDGRRVDKVLASADPDAEEEGG